MQLTAICHARTSAKTTFKCPSHLMDRVYGKINANVGQNKEPLIDFFKTENIIPDILHLFLRVSDKLINLLKSDLQQMDLNFSTLIEDNVNFKE